MTDLIGAAMITAVVQVVTIVVGAVVTLRKAREIGDDVKSDVRNVVARAINATQPNADAPPRHRGDRGAAP